MDGWRKAEEGENKREQLQLRGLFTPQLIHPIEELEGLILQQEGS